MDRKKITVVIDGKEYTILSGDSKEHVFNVSDKVNEMITTIRKNNKNLSTSMVAMLTALNIMDEYLKLKKQMEEEAKEKEASEALLSVQEQLERLQGELQENRKRAEKSEEKIFYLQRKLTDKEEELQRAKDELEEFINEIDGE